MSGLIDDSRNIAEERRAAAEAAAYGDFRTWYLQQIEPYKNSPYYERLLNNPYLSDGSEYTPSWFERTFSQGAFGDYSGMQNFYSTRNSAAKEELFKILGEMQQNEYNSAEGVASREKAAGYNPALAGLSGEPAVGSPGADETQSPPAPSAEQIRDSFFAQAMQGGLNFFQQVLSFGSFIQQFKGASLDNQLKDIQVTGNAYEQVLNMVAGELNFSTGDDGVESIEGFERNSSMDDTLADAFSRASGKVPLYSSRRVQQLMKRLRGQVQYDKDGKPSLAYQRFREKFVADLLRSRKEGAGVLGTFGYDDDIEKFGKTIAETFSNVSQKLWSKQMEFQQKYWDSLNPDAKAGSENAKWTYDGQYFGYVGEDGTPIGQQIAANDWRAAHSQELQKELDTIVDQEFQNLARKCKVGDKWYHTVGLFLIPLARALLTRLAGAQFSFSRPASSSSPIESFTSKVDGSGDNFGLDLGFFD